MDALHKNFLTADKLDLIDPLKFLINQEDMVNQEDTDKKADKKTLIASLFQGVIIGYSQIMADKFSKLNGEKEGELQQLNEENEDESSQLNEEKEVRLQQLNGEKDERLQQTGEILNKFHHYIENYGNYFEAQYDLQTKFHSLDEGEEKLLIAEGLEAVQESFLKNELSMGLLTEVMIQASKDDVDLQETDSILKKIEQETSDPKAGKKINAVLLALAAVAILLASTAILIATSGLAFSCEFGRVSAWYNVAGCCIGLNGCWSYETGDIFTCHPHPARHLPRHPLNHRTIRPMIHPTRQPAPSP